MLNVPIHSYYVQNITCALNFNTQNTVVRISYSNTHSDTQHTYLCDTIFIVHF